MGNSLCNCPAIFDRLQLPNLQRKSTYGKQEQQLDRTMLSAMITEPRGFDRSQMVLAVIKDKDAQQFLDDKFKLEGMENTRLSQLLNYKKNNIKIFQRSSNTQYSNFVQLNIEFSYLSSVFYFYYHQQIKRELLQTVIQAQTVNDEGYYILNYYCNGTPHAIVIDDYIPTNKESYLYLRIVYGQEIWPALMEKAWAKQIGSYNKALGLSPEDTFQQITGIPTYSYQITNNNKASIRSLIQSSHTQNKWITFVARQGLQDFENRHVFCLKSIDNGYYNIVSPYTKFRFEKYQQTRRGQVRLRQENIYNIFEYVVVGHYKPGFKNSCTHVKSKSHEQLIYEFNVVARQEISIRFNQYYKGYISEDYKEKYQYSPVLMEIYQLVETEHETSFILKQNLQGCRRARAGARSIYFTKDVFHQFTPGRYFIRIQVDWSHESHLSQGNLNIYSMNGDIKAEPIKNNNQFLSEVYPSLIKAKLREHNSQDQRQAKEGQIIDKKSIGQHKLNIVTYYKKNTTLMMFENEQDFPQKFQIDLQKSQNILIRGGKVNGKKTVLQIEGGSQAVIEIVPLKVLQESTIDNYQIINMQQGKQ